MIFEILNQFFKFILNVFFRNIRVRGFHNIPKDGPILFACAPHCNQFVDPMMLFTTCGRKIGFLIAKKSWDRLFIGFMARMFNSIPVVRKQDVTIDGKGKVYCIKHEGRLMGIDSMNG